MSDDETRPIDPEAPARPPTPPPRLEPQPPAYAMPLRAGYPAYAAQQRPRFADQVLGMRAVVAVALACLIIGGLSGFILGRAAGDSQNRFFQGPGGFAGFEQPGTFPTAPNGTSNGPDGIPNQQFGQGQNNR